MNKFQLSTPHKNKTTIILAVFSKNACFYMLFVHASLDNFITCYREEIFDIGNQIAVTMMPRIVYFNNSYVQSTSVIFMESTIVL